MTPLEPDCQPESQWESIVVKEAETTTFLNQGRHRRNANVEDNSENETINFWDIIYPSEQQNCTLGDIAKEVLPCAFESYDFQGLFDVA
jgi:hypothetical protein